MPETKRSSKTQVGPETVKATYNGKRYLGAWSVDRRTMLVQSDQGSRKISTYGYERDLARLAEKTLLAIIVDHGTPTGASD